MGIKIGWSLAANVKLKVKVAGSKIPYEKIMFKFSFGNVLFWTAPQSVWFVDHDHVRDKLGEWEEFMN